MIFDEVFLQSQNDDCLGQVLSFLTCQDLANVARTCKVLKHTIFEAEEANVNLSWKGAEEALTNPSDVHEVFTYRRARVGANAREHCHLYAVASKAAKACELSGEIEENRIKMDGILANLMNVRGFDAKSLAEKKALAAANTQTLEEASAEIEIRNWGAEESEETKQRRREKWEKIAQLTEPTKTYYHDIFVRITRTATGEMISEGFCSGYQKLPWYAGLEMSRDYRRIPALSPQGLQIILDFGSLNQSGEMQNFLGALSSSSEGVFDAMCSEGPGINLTAVVIDRRNHSTHCLFQHGQTAETGLRTEGPGFGVVRDFYKYDFFAFPRWDLDRILLGPSISEDLYFLGFSLSLCVAKKMDGCTILVPLLEVNLNEDRTAFHNAGGGYLRVR